MPKSSVGSSLCLEPDLRSRYNTDEPDLEGPHIATCSLYLPDRVHKASDRVHKASDRVHKAFGAPNRAK